jgi:hypothetical protein
MLMNSLKTVRFLFIKRFNIKEIITDSQNDHQMIDNNHQSDHEVSITQDFLDTLKKQLETKDEEIKKFHILIENHQKISLHAQMLFDKNMIQLVAKSEANKKNKIMDILKIKL